jgi:uncharacterized membrane protein HdeD (DUF308 family)
MWNKVKSFFKFSETIFWARLQVMVAALFGLVTFVDPSLVTAVIPVEWVPIWLLLSGVATEWLRRRRSNL